MSFYFRLEVFVTVESEEQYDFIKRHYREIKEDHIGVSGSPAFELIVLKHTRERGVDYIINVMSEEKSAAVRCLAKGGKFINIENFNFVPNEVFDLNLLTNDIEFRVLIIGKFSTESEIGKPLLIYVLIFSKIRNKLAVLCWML